MPRNHRSGARARLATAKVCAPPAGLTMVELLVVVAVIGMLVALLLPAVQAARESARRGQCQNNLRQLTVAFEHHAERDRAYPVGCIGCKFTPPSPGNPFVPQRFISWNVQLLPLLEQSELWKGFDFLAPSYQTVNKAVGAHQIELFLCPSTVEETLLSPSGLWRDTAFTDYAGIFGIEGPGHNSDPADPSETQPIRRISLGVMIYDEVVQPRQVTDGLSHTAWLAETLFRRQLECEWVNGNNLFAQESSTPLNSDSGLNNNEIGSPHPSGASLAFCDGHVQFVPESTDQSVLNAMLTKAGGEQ